MDDQRTPVASDPPCPLVFVVLAVFASALAWLCVMLAGLPLR